MKRSLFLLYIPNFPQFSQCSCIYPAAPYQSIYRATLFQLSVNISEVERILHLIRFVFTFIHNASLHDGVCSRWVWNMVSKIIVNILHLPLSSYCLKYMPKYITKLNYTFLRIGWWKLLISLWEKAFNQIDAYRCTFKLISPLKPCLLFLQMFILWLNVYMLDFIKTFVCPTALVATTGSGGVRGDDASGLDVEHPCGGSAVVERPTAVTVQSTVKAEHVSRLLTRALHRVADIKQTYVSIQYTLVSFCRAEVPFQFVLLKFIQTWHRRYFRRWHALVS